MVSKSPKLRRLRADGCASLDGELHLSSRALREVTVEGCARLQVLRVAAPVRSLDAKGCKGLTAVWLEDPPPPPPPPEASADDEGGSGGGGGGGLVEEKKRGDDDDEGEEEDVVTDDVLRLDLRNCSSLVRLVGVRVAALEGKLRVRLSGCTSLPASARPPTNIM
jgi:hypothetical protein